jgi:hypothetical protein
VIQDANVTFGSTYKDDVTGFVGKATAHVRYYHAESTVRLEALAHDGGEVKTEWFPVKRLSFAT